MERSEISVMADLSDGHKWIICAKWSGLEWFDDGLLNHDRFNAFADEIKSMEDEMAKKTFTIWDLERPVISNQEMGRA